MADFSFLVADRQLPFVVASALMLIGAALVWAIDPDERAAEVAP